MPLLPGCNFPNPVNNNVAPPVPAAAQAPSLAPAQGDHVFGDVVGMVQTALQRIFGGGALWATRFQAFSAQAAGQWQSFSAFDLGHAGGNEPLVQRVGAPEPDEHAHVFGNYALRFQWSFCEIVCAGHNPQETRRIGGGTRAWRRTVMSRYDDVVLHLVDQTALTSYLANPAAVRQANAGAVRHPVISLQAARQQAQASNGQGAPRIAQICANYHAARASLEGMLMRFDGPTRTMNGAAWV